MATKMFPPIVPGISNACYGTTLVVPFSHNKMGNNGAALKARVRTANTDRVIFETTAVGVSEESGQLYATIAISDYLSKFVIGNNYKVQLAYYKDGEEGYYSTVCIVKYTSIATVSIAELSKNKTNINIYSYTGTYTNEDDPTEKVDTYCFILYDKDKQVQYDTGWKIHNSVNDTDSFTSIDVADILIDIPDGQQYSIEYKVITKNGINFSSGLYKIQNSLLNNSPACNVIATNDFYDGRILVHLDNISADFAEGYYLLTRTDSKSDYTRWDKLKLIYLLPSIAHEFEYSDLFIEQGENYQYSLQQQIGNKYSQRVKSNFVYAEFEYTFLFDGERQLCLKLNNNVSTFQNKLQESVKPTLGNQYPFIFRNGTVKYKEFPIDALISYWQDENQLFMDFDNLVVAHETPASRVLKSLGMYADEDPCSVPDKFYPTTEYTDDNISAERRFKMEVLEWLNNGELKVFKSPTEGNFIVYLTNVSLTPFAQTGRMIHTFKATADEVAEYSMATIKDAGLIPELIKPQRIVDESQYQFKHIALEDVITTEVLEEHNTISKLISYLNTYNWVEGYTYNYIKISDCPLMYGNIGGSEKHVGPIGEYQADFDTNYYNILTLTFDENTLNRYCLVKDGIIYSFSHPGFVELVVLPEPQEEEEIEQEVIEYPALTIEGGTSSILSSLEGINENSAITWQYLRIQLDINNSDVQSAYFANNGLLDPMENGENLIVFTYKGEEPTTSTMYVLNQKIISLKASELTDLKDISIGSYLIADAGLTVQADKVEVNSDDEPSIE